MPAHIRAATVSISCIVSLFVAGDTAPGVEAVRDDGTHHGGPDDHRRVTLGQWQAHVSTSRFGLPSRSYVSAMTVTVFVSVLTIGFLTPLSRKTVATAHGPACVVESWCGSGLGPGGPWWQAWETTWAALRVPQPPDIVVLTGRQPCHVHRVVLT